jgi:hypothetical protein
MLVSIYYSDVDSPEAETPGARALRDQIQHEGEPTVHDLKHIFNCTRARFSSYYVTSFAAAEYPTKRYVGLSCFIGFSHEVPGPVNAQGHAVALTSSVTQDTPQATGR